MKSPLLTLLLLAVAFPLHVVSADTAPKYPPHVIANSELRVLPTNADGRTYQLSVHLPGSFRDQPGRRYPVLFVTDGYWDFPTIVTSYDNLAYDKVVPEFIVVGLGYAGENLDYGQLRNWELSPVKTGLLAFGTGHADKFLVTLEHEIIPFIEREYRADPAYRVLAGSSLGGLFALYAMYTRPDLFQGYIAASPAVGAGGDWLLDYARAFGKSGRPIKARLYVTGAENESAGFLAGIRRYQQLLPELKHPELVYGTRIIDGERHAGEKAESYVRGMRFVFAPLAPETGPTTN